VLVTGAAGFIGSHVTRVLLDAGCEVLALVSPGDEVPWRLSDLMGVVDVNRSRSGGFESSHGRLRLLRGRLSDTPSLESSVTSWRPEACIHLAWYAEPGKYLTSDENLASLKGSLALLDVLGRSGCKNVVMTGTCAEYDTDRGWLREDGPTRPATLYAAAKLSMCLLGQQLALANKMNFAWARIFYPYGEFEDPRRMVPSLIRALLDGQRFAASSGEQIRDYIHAGDVATALWALANRGTSGVFNVCSGEPVSVRGLMETIADAVGRPGLIDFGAAPVRAWEPPVICGDNARARGVDWQPRRLRVGIEQTVRWWRTRSFKTGCRHSLTSDVVPTPQREA
jgi:dTDP-6-deoxy-L-talose 4-dehydrogenase (NAD+)